MFRTISSFIAISIFSFANSISGRAQVKIGNNANVISSSSILELESTTKMLVPPRMTNSQMNAILNPMEGGMLFCTNCSPKGMWVFDGGAFVPIGTPALVASFVSGSLNCTGTATGTYQQGVPTGSGNSKTITINASGTGSYEAATTIANGVSFSDTGILLSTGPGTQIVLQASGTPIASGSFSYTASVGGQFCTFTVVYTTVPNSFATLSCGSAVSSFSPAVIGNNTSHTGTYAIPYTAGNGSNYGAFTLTTNGITMTRTPGTYAISGGNVVYTFGGTHSGNRGSERFNLPEGCTVYLGDAIRGALAVAGCTSCAAYDAAADDTWVRVTAAEYANTASTTYMISATSTGAANANIASPTSYGWPANTTVGPAPTSTAAPWAVTLSNRYIVAYKTIFNGSNTDAQLKVGSSVSNGFVNYGSSTNMSNGLNHFVLKKPTTLTGTTPFLGLYTGSGTASMGVGTVVSPVWNASGNVGTLGSSSSGEPAIQVISTSAKQW